MGKDSSTIIPPSSMEFTKLIRYALGDPSDIQFESLAADKATIAYLTSLVNQTDLQTNLVSPLKQLYLSNTEHTWEEVLSYLPQVGEARRENVNDAADDLVSGKAVVHLAGTSLVYSFNTARSIQRQPSEPLIERTVRGPRVSLVEMLADNLRSR